MSFRNSNQNSNRNEYPSHSNQNSNYYQKNNPNQNYNHHFQQPVINRNPNTAKNIEFNSRKNSKNISNEKSGSIDRQQFINVNVQQLKPHTSKNMDLHKNRGIPYQAKPSNNHNINNKRPNSTCQESQRDNSMRINNSRVSINDSHQGNQYLDRRHFQSVEKINKLRAEKKQIENSELRNKPEISKNSLKICEKLGYKDTNNYQKQEQKNYNNDKLLYYESKTTQGSLNRDRASSNQSGRIINNTNKNTNLNNYSYHQSNNNVNYNQSNNNVNYNQSNNNVNYNQMNNNLYTNHVKDNFVPQQHSESIKKSYSSSGINTHNNHNSKLNQQNKNNQQLNLFKESSSQKKENFDKNDIVNMLSPQAKDFNFEKNRPSSSNNSQNYKNIGKPQRNTEIIEKQISAKSSNFNNLPNKIDDMKENFHEFDMFSPPNKDAQKPDLKRNYSSSNIHPKTNSGLNQYGNFLSNANYNQNHEIINNLGNNQIKDYARCNNSTLDSNQDKLYKNLYDQKLNDYNKNMEVIERKITTLKQQYDSNSNLKKGKDDYSHSRISNNSLSRVKESPIKGEKRKDDLSNIKNYLQNMREVTKTEDNKSVSKDRVYDYNPTNPQSRMKLNENSKKFVQERMKEMSSVSNITNHGKKYY